MTAQSESALLKANRAYLAGDSAGAMAGYAAGLQTMPELGQMLVANMARARQQNLNKRMNKTKPKVIICGWELAHNAAGRAHTLAEIYRAFAEVEIVGSIFPGWGREVWKPMRETSIAVKTFIVEPNRYIEQAMELVAANPADVVHLSKPRAPNMIFGILYKLLWQARVILDIDDEELSFVNAQTPHMLANYLEQHGALPLVDQLPHTDWTRLAVGLVREFDAMTVSNIALQRRYGGVIIGHARDPQVLTPSTELRQTSRRAYGIGPDHKVVLFAGTPRPHKGLLEVARAIQSLHRSDILFVCAGSFDAHSKSLKGQLQGVKGVSYLFLENQPLAALPRILATADCCVLMQDLSHAYTSFQIPAKLSDALAMRIPVIASATPALADVIAAGAVIAVTPESLASQLAATLDQPDQGLVDAGHRYFTEHLSLAANAMRLQQLLDTTISSPISPPLKQLFDSLAPNNPSLCALNNHPMPQGEPPNPYPLFGSIPTIRVIHPYDIDLPAYQEPKVSVLIPVCGKLDYTMACLKSISDNLPKSSFEVIVLDDRSPDDSVQTLNKIKNLRVIANTENFGFLRSCNNGAQHAEGAFLLFLNNDTQVMPGWLDELLATFDLFPSCGLAGSKLIYPDGVLQEAGGIVWQDGSAWNYGKQQDPALPAFNYARKVDYVSGASIMVPATLFQEFGGFDERYAPAYYEDTDLCMRIRAQGKSVIYQPLSVVVHFEGVSSGTDIRSGIKAYQKLNRETFFKRWESVLRTHRPPGVAPHLERDRGAKGRVLFIDACTPTPDQDSGSVDIFNLMKLFVELGWTVSFIPEDNYAFVEKYTSALQRMGVQALYHPHIHSVDDHISTFGRNYQLIMAFRPMVTHRHISNLRQKCPQAKIIYNTVDLHFLRLGREAQLKDDSALQREAKKYKAIELELMNLADLTTVVSSAEHELLQKMGLQRVVHLPVSRAVRPSNEPFESRSGLVFVGGFRHNPNVDAVLYFVAEIMPLIRELLPGVVINIVGSSAPKEVRDLACDDIVVHGFVEDLESLIDTMRLNVAPLRYGAGTKGKVIYALANGLPTVATSIAVEGLGLKNMAHVGIADTASDFAKAICHAYSNRSLWERLSRNGLSYAEQVYGIGALKVNLETKILSLF